MVTLYLFVILAVGMANAMPYCSESPLCDVWCPFGYVRDEYGCALCQCLDPAPPAEDSSACTPPLCLFFQPACEVYIKDDKGCDTCECATPINPKHEENTHSPPAKTCIPRMCPFYLPACGVYKKDAKGCDTCECEVAIPDIVRLKQRKSNPAVKGIVETALAQILLSCVKSIGDLLRSTNVTYAICGRVPPVCKSPMVGRLPRVLWVPPPIIYWPPSYE